MKGIHTFFGEHFMHKVRVAVEHQAFSSDYQLKASDYCLHIVLCFVFRIKNDLKNISGAGVVARHKASALCMPA